MKATCNLSGSGEVWHTIRVTGGGPSGATAQIKNHDNDASVILTDVIVSIGADSIQISGSTRTSAGNRVRRGFSFQNVSQE